jgi:flagellar motor switch protein FliN/FliY
MKNVLTKDEALSKLKESLSTRLAQAMEAMTGNTQRCLLIQDLEAPAGDLLGWTAKYSAAPNVELRIFAAPEDWKLIGKAILEAAGVDTFDDPTLESTYTETMAQAASSWAPDLSGMAGKKWETDSTAVGADPDPSASTWGYRFPMGDSEAKISVQVSSQLLAELLQPPPSPEPAAQTSNAPIENTTNASQFDLLLDVELPVSVSFGRALVPLKEVLKLSSGSIVELNRAVTEPVEVIVNNCVIARGEVVVVEGNYGVRIQQIVSRQDRLRTVN